LPHRAHPRILVAIIQTRTNPRRSLFFEVPYIVLFNPEPPPILGRGREERLNEICNLDYARVVDHLSQLR
jgi:hypothetical protein